MKILVAGNGDTATHLAKMLSREDQEVVVMGTDEDVLSALDSKYNVMTSFGKATSVSALRQSGAAGSDLFIAVTPYENHNIVAAQIAKWLGSTTTIARIDNDELLEKDTYAHFRSLGIDKMVYPELLAANEISRSIHHVWMRSFQTVSGDRICICSVKLTGDAPVIDKTLIEFGQMTRNFHVALIKRNGTPVIPGGPQTLRKDDVVYFTFLPDHEKELSRLCGKENHRVDSIMIAGAGKISESICRRLTPEHSVKIIDPDREKCLRIASRCPHVTVVNAPFNDTDVLREEGIRNNCIFMALAESSETNLVSAMVAKHLGALKAIAQIEDIQFFDEAQSLDIDTIINKKLLTSSRIYQILLDSYLDSPRCLAFEDTDVIEIVARESSKVTQKKVRDLNIPPEMTIAGLTRDGEGMLVNGDTLILPGDHVVVFCLRGNLKKADRLFR